MKVTQLLTQDYVNASLIFIKEDVKTGCVRWGARSQLWANLLC